jgi:peptidoglycan/xylan/chitin deacetylase (PgdA/CDA1 family)
MYHSIGHNPVSFTVRPEEFQKQMDYLLKENYNVISLDELIISLKKKEISQKAVVLTFDDGFEDNYFNAFPVLKKYNFPATIFLSTGFIEKEIPNSAKIPLKILDWRQIKEMYNSGLVDFEPHTVNHPKLTQISLEEAKKEILDSKRIIEEKLNKKCKFFAYPYGRYTQEIIKILKESGFEGAVTIKEGLVSAGDDLFSLKRNSINSLTTLSQFKGKLNLSVDIFRKIFKDE